MANSKMCERCGFFDGGCVCIHITTDAQLAAYRELGKVATIDSDGTVTVGLDVILEMLTDES